MSGFASRHPAWTLVLVVLCAVLLWMIFAVWPPELEQAIGRKRVFLSALLNGITLGSLYFLVASGFTLIFGLMRNVNLAHGSLYLLGGYVGYGFASLSGYWFLGVSSRLRDRRTARDRVAGGRVPLDGRTGAAPDTGDDRNFHPCWPI